MGWILFWIIWLICGVLAYGVIKNNSCSALSGYKGNGYSDIGEQLCLMFGMLGIFGLLTATSIAWRHKYKLGLCFRMPEELCSPEYLRKK